MTDEYRVEKFQKISTQISYAASQSWKTNYLLLWLNGKADSAEDNCWWLLVSIVFLLFSLVTLYHQIVRLFLIYDLYVVLEIIFHANKEHWGIKSIFDETPSFSLLF